MNTKTITILAVLMIINCSTKAQLLASGNVPKQNEKKYSAESTNKTQFSTPEDVVKPDMEARKIKGINSDFQEIGPLVSPDGKTLYFSRYDHVTEKSSVHTHEDIWFARWDEQNNTWGLTQNMGRPINNEHPNYINSISPDGNTILLGNTYEKNGNMKNGLSMSHFENGKWSFPENLKIKKQKRFFNWSSSHLSNDGKVLIISSEKHHDTYGTGDLYVSLKKADNTWSAPVNLGAIVNSVGSETSPFLSADEKTLFYASNGLGGFGGSDIFMTIRLDETWKNWSKPINLGAKINSAGEEAYFSISASDNKIYFSSDLNSEHDLDIYTLDKPEVLNSEPAIVEPAKEAVTITETEIAPESKKLKDANTPVTVLSPIYFEFNKAEVSTEANSQFETIFKLMKEDPTLKLEVAGNTDNKGSERYNKTLSRKRAKSISDLLIRNGVNAKNIKLSSLAASNPKGDNATEEGRALNRRVDIIIVQK